jgi:hypothetical protein
MDYIAWCEHFLERLAATGRRDAQSKGYVNLALLAQQMFGLDSIQGYGSGERESALHTAAEDWQRFRLTEPYPRSLQLWRITEEGERFVADLARGVTPPLKEAIRHIDTRSVGAIVPAVNRLSPHEEEDYAWVEDIDDAIIMGDIKWQADRRSFRHQTNILEHAGSYFLKQVGSFRIRATYGGLLWGKTH